MTRLGDMMLEVAPALMDLHGETVSVRAHAASETVSQLTAISGDVVDRFEHGLDGSERIRERELTLRNSDLPDLDDDHQFQFSANDDWWDVASIAAGDAMSICSLVRREPVTAAHPEYHRRRYAS